MMTDEPTANTTVAGCKFYAIVVHASFGIVHRSEFDFGDNERVGGGKLFHRRVHEFIHTAFPGLNRRQ